MIDDNNGLHATGSGTGIAPGCIRFTQDPMWAAVPIGTLIVIHNDGDPNAAVPATDLSMADGNCRLVIPVSNCALLEKHGSMPSTANATYPSSGFSSCGNWTNLSMANGDDSFQTVDPSGNVFHSVSWGNNNQNTIIYFAGSSGGTVARMMNITNNNINTQANWTRVAVAGNESPGAANSPANQAWICSMNNGCTAPVPMTLTETHINAGCTCNGSATVTATGGFSGCGSLYTYSWAPTGGNAATANGLCAGTYTCTVTDIVGCTSTIVVNITGSAGLSATPAQTNVLCNGGNNGSASVNVSGGTGPYTYAWSPSGGNAATAAGLTAGVYTVVFTDVIGCTGSQTFSITQPSAITTAGSHTNVACNGGSTGSAGVVAFGGAGGYSYAWSPSGGTGNSATGLSAGTYTVIITDANGCTPTRQYSITQPNAITATTTQTNVLCNGAATGSAMVNAIGGTGAFTFTWSPSGGTAATATGLNAGLYTVTITDANSCTATQTFNITEPAALTSVISFTAATCGSPNGSASVNVSGGTGAYTYAWSPSGGSSATASALSSGNYTVTFTDANGCTGTHSVNVSSVLGPTVTIVSSDSVSCFGGSDGAAAANTSGGTAPYTYLWSNADNDSLAGNLTAGSYSVTVTDASGCTGTTSIVIAQPAALNISMSTTSALCFGSNTGSASANITGGAGPFMYAWSPIGGNNAVASSLSAGNYSVSITDANGCTANATVAVTAPSAITTSISADSVLCAGGATGSATVTASGGTGAFSYSWSPAGGSSASALSLSTGNYTVIVTDANGCSHTDSVLIEEPAALTVTTSVTDASCNLNNGSVTAAANGGTGTVAYQWTNAGGPSSATWSTIPAGSYSVIATDANGCTATAIQNVNNLGGVTASLSASANITCFGGADGMIDIDHAGGNGPYTYAWTPNVSVSDIGAALTAGIYSVTITDGGGCTSSVTVLLTEPPQLTVLPVALPATVCEGTTVQLNAAANGGVAGYSFTWNPGPLTGASHTLTPAATTTYTATVTDGNGCTASSTVQVIVNPKPVASFTGDVNTGCAPVCADFDDLSALASGSITSWSWDFGDSNTSTVQDPAAHCYTNAGVYSVQLIVTSAAGCADTITISNLISVLAVPAAAFGYDPHEITTLAPLIQFSDSSANATAWLWNFGDASSSTSSDQHPSFTYDAAGCYPVSLIVSNSAGCADTAEQLVCIAPEVTLYVPNAFTPNSNGHNDVFIPVGTGISESGYHLMIYDRWGNLVFETKNCYEGWDGRKRGHSDLCQMDTYVWKLKWVDAIGVEHDAIGHVNLLP
jgi:gliding motility-associated-like protein